MYWDGNSTAELGYDDGSKYVYKDTKNNRKLADTVTYDDNGDVIPLSKRFNERKQDVRFSLKEDAMHKAGDDVVRPDELDTALVDELDERMRKAGLDVVTDKEEGQRMLDEANGRAKLMGSRTERKKARIAQELDGRELTEEQQAVVDVFTGRSDNQRIVVKDKDGKQRTIVMRQGNEAKAGTRHSLSGHFGSSKNYYNTDEILLIPELISNGERNQNEGNKVSYKIEKDGVTFTVTTEVKGKEEVFTNFFTNRKPTVAEQGASDTDEQHAQPQQSDSTAKLQKVSETTKSSPVFFRTSDGEAYGFTLDGKIYIDRGMARADTPVHEYGHLWAEAVRRGSPEEWERIRKVLMDDEDVRPFAEKVRERYPELNEGSDAFVDEVLQHYSGTRGYERLRLAAEEIAGENASTEKKTVANRALQKVKDTLNRFWGAVAKLMGWKYRKAGDIADTVLRDLLSGVDPRKMRRENGEWKGEETTPAVEKPGIRPDGKKFSLVVVNDST